MDYVPIQPGLVVQCHLLHLPHLLDLPFILLYPSLMVGIPLRHLCLELQELRAECPVHRLEYVLTLVGQLICLLLTLLIHDEPVSGEVVRYQFPVLQLADAHPWVFPFIDPLV